MDDSSFLYTWIAVYDAEPTVAYYLTAAQMTVYVSQSKLSRVEVIIEQGLACESRAVCVQTERHKCDWPVRP